MNRRNDTSSRARGRERRLPETKSFILSSEFWVFAVAAGALLFAGYVLNDIRDPTAWRFAAFVAIAYIVSRGIAKAGSSREYEARVDSRYGDDSDYRDDWRDRGDSRARDDYGGDDYRTGDRPAAEWTEQRSQAVSRDVGREPTPSGSASTTNEPPTRS